MLRFSPCLLFGLLCSRFHHRTQEMRLLCLLVLLCLEAPGDSFEIQGQDIDKNVYAKIFQCVKLLCKMSPDYTECKKCLMEVNVSQLPVENLLRCLEEIPSCDEKDTTALGKVRKCIEKESPEMGGCFSGEHDSTHSINFPALE